MNSPSKDNLKILISRITHIGDTLLYTPALRGIRQRYPYGEISCIATPLTLEVLRGNKDIDRIICFKEGYEEEKFFETMQEKKFDIIINFSAAVKDYLFCYKMGGKLRIAPVYNKMLVSQLISLFTVHKRIICHDDPGDYQKAPSKYTLLHEVQQNQKIASMLDVPPVDSPLILPLEEEKEFGGVFMNHFLLREKPLISDGEEKAKTVVPFLAVDKKPIAFQISERWFWGLKDNHHGISNLIKELRSKYTPNPIFCFYHPSTKAIAEKVISQLNSQEGDRTKKDENSVSRQGEIINIRFNFNNKEEDFELLKVKDKEIFFIPPLPLKRYASLVKECLLIITMHSGTTHISASVGLPSVVVFLNALYFDYFSQRESPWKVPFSPIHPILDIEEARKLSLSQRQEKERELINRILKGIESITKP